MAKMYKPTDKIQVKVDDLIFSLSPLTMDQKQELLGYIAKGKSSEDLTTMISGVRLALRYTIKDIKGLEDCDGNPYKLTFDKDGYLSEDDCDALLNLEYSESINIMCMTMANRVPEEFLNADGSPLRGVSRIKKPSKKGKGNKSPN